MRMWFIAVSLATVLMTLSGVARADPTPSDEEGEGSQIWALQAPIDETNAKIDEFLAANPGWLDYYAGSEADVPSQRLQINIKPGAPEELYKELAKLGSSVKMSFAEAVYSYNDMQSEAVRLLQGGSLAGVALLSSGDGLKVTPDAATSGLVAERTSAGSPMIVEVEDAVTTDPAVATRQNDSSASPGWKGGTH